MTPKIRVRVLDDSPLAGSLLGESLERLRSMADPCASRSEAMPPLARAPGATPQSTPAP